MTQVTARLPDDLVTSIDAAARSSIAAGPKSSARRWNTTSLTSMTSA